MCFRHPRPVCKLWFVASLALGLHAARSSEAETGYAAWLRYEPVPASIRPIYERLPHTIVNLENTPVATSAETELIRGVNGMLGIELRTATCIETDDAMVLCTVDSARKVIRERAISLKIGAPGGEDFVLESVEADGRRLLFVVGGSDRGLLYGAFALLRRIALHEPIENLSMRERPYAPIRILNHWDNLDGTIERGYAGKSIFWENDHVAADLQRVSDYGRLLASLGINGCSINNVNADARVVSAEYLAEVARVAEAFRPWGVRVYIALNFASPREIGGVETFDPLDPNAVAFWKKTVDAVYRAVPDLGGFVLKADSEGRLGPSEYNRTHADAANAIARALKPHSGTLFYRGFVYNHKMDWRDLKNDRAKAAYNNFRRLDGLFEDNVVIQIKHGPIDFQVREPASPLFGALEDTNQAIELQITQEYLGQQRHVCYTVPMWKESLDFDMHARGKDTPVKELVAGRTFDRPTGGFVGVSNVGRDENWLGHHLAMANLYGFGRLAWDPDLSSREIAEEWTRQTFGHDSLVVDTVADILLRSWPIYESYTGPLGIGTLTDIIHIHFGPAPESSEYNGWGQWHRANETGVGMDRTVQTGTGFIGQYRPPVAAMFQSLETCPDELLLFMHHVPYTHRLHAGKTVIQHFYDEHYAGAEAAAGLVDQWQALEGRIDAQRYQDVLDRLEYQAGHAQVWRDAICRWFMQRSGIPDDHDRVGNYPNRLEAEDQRLKGYQFTSIEPWEAASGRGAAEIGDRTETGSLRFEYSRAARCCELWIQYFDEDDGGSTFKLFVDDKLIDEWTADGRLPTPTTKPDAHSSTRRIVRIESIEPGDEIRIEAIADGGERATVDYVEFHACAQP